MASITAVVDDVTQKPTQSGKTKYTVRAGGHYITAFELDKAEAAKACKGQLSVIEYTEKQNGEYLNKNLVSIRLADQASANVAKAAPASNPPASLVDPTRSSIERQVALKAAVEFFKPMGEAATVGGIVAAASAFASFLEGDEKAPTAGPSEGSALDDDVPFAPTV